VNLSLNSIQKHHFRFNLSRNPLSPQQTEFLRTDKQKLEDEGWKLGSYQSGFRTSLEHSLQHITWILNNTQNLRKNEVYEIFNAKSMEYVLSNLLRKDGHLDYQYDFRTSELARMSFEMMLDYLLQFPQFKDQKEIIKNLVKALSGYFEILSRSTLSLEDNEKTISREEQERNEDYLKKHDYRNEFKQLKQEIQELYLELFKLEKRKESNIILESIKEQIQFKEKRFDEIEKEGFIIEGYLSRQSNVYNHLESYISRIKPLVEFDYMLQRIGNDFHIMDITTNKNKKTSMFVKSYVVDVDNQFNEDKAMQEFEDKMWDEYSKKITSKKELAKLQKKISIFISHSKKEGVVQIPMSIFNDELRKFFKKKKLGDKYGTPKHHTLSEAD